MITSTDIIPEDLNPALKEMLEKTNWYERARKAYAPDERKELMREKAEAMNRIGRHTMISVQIALNDWDSEVEFRNRINHQKKGQIILNWEIKVIRYKPGCDGITKEYAFKNNITGESRRRNVKMDFIAVEHAPTIYGEESSGNRQFITFDCLQEHLEQYMNESMRMIKELESTHDQMSS